MWKPTFPSNRFWCILQDASDFSIVFNLRTLLFRIHLFSAIARYWDFSGHCCFHMPWCAVSIASWGGRNGRPTLGLMMLRKDIWDCVDLGDGRALKRKVSWFKKLLQGIFVLRMVFSVLQSLTILFARWRLCIDFFFNAYWAVVRSRSKVRLLSRVQYLSFFTEP